MSRDVFATHSAHTVDSFEVSNVDLEVGYVVAHAFEGAVHLTHLLARAVECNAHPHPRSA